jgi:hypothetical protein
MSKFLKSWSDAEVYETFLDLQNEKYKREVTLVHAQIVDELKMMKRTDAFANVKVEKSFNVWDTHVTLSRDEYDYKVTISSRGLSVCGTCRVLRELQENPRYNIEVKIPSLRIHDELTDIRLALYKAFEDAFVHDFSLK